MNSHIRPVSPLRCAAFALVALQAFAFSAASSALDLAKNGSTDFRIVLPKDAIPAEQTAAKELQDYLHRITGALLPISGESAVSSTSPQILVGMGERVREYLAKQKLSPPVKDGMFIKTLSDALILAGGRPRGSLYAVYTFLEDSVGVRWWTSSESTVPRKPTLRIPDLDTRYCPKLLYREAYYRDPLGNSPFAARMKLNGHMSSIPESLGGHYTIIGWCHTSYEFLPPGGYFGAHPDWYSMQNGRRSPGGGQLCWSNAEMRRELARQALARIRKQPTAGIISISQNDCMGACQCDACRTIENAEGAPSGPLIQGINAVAADIGKEFPDFLIETLAYQYSRKPPARIRPAANVLVRLCSIEADNSHALSSDANAGFRDDLRGWKTIAPNLFVWNYVTSFANYLIPHPNMTPLGADLRFFAENNVIGVFEQGDAMNGTGDFLPLRVWLLAHLMWDPSRDQAALREEFLQGYYGPAAPFLAQYLDLVNAPAQSASFRLSCYNNDTSFLSDAALVEAAKLFDRAEMAVAGSADWARRVKRERLVLDHMQLLRYDFPGRLRAREGDESVCGGYDARTVRFIEAAKEMGVHNLAEGQSFDSYIPVLKARSLRYLPPPRMPVPGTALPEGCFDIQEDRFSLVGVGTWSELTTDSKASNGKAARMAGDHTNWAVQFHVPKDAPFTGHGPWKCYIVARCKPKARRGGAFAYGLHHASSNTYIARDAASLEVAGDDEYHAYGIFVDELKPEMYFWIAPPGNAAWVDSIYVDRIYIQRAAPKDQPDEAPQPKHKARQRR